MKEEYGENKRDKDWDFADLISTREWQKIQEGFAAVTDVGLRTVDSKGDDLTKPSGQPRLCTHILKDHYLKVSGACMPTFLGGRGVVDRNLSFLCQHGLSNFVAPLRVPGNGSAIAYLILGPVVLVMRRAKEEYRKLAEELNIDLEEFWKALLEIKVISFQSARSLVELIKYVGEYSLNLAHKTLMREKIGYPEDSPDFGRFLNSLLEVAFHVSGADIGSIMYLDRQDKEFKIRASRGIPEEFIKDARIKWGEGIAGIAAKEKTSFLINDDVADNRIKPYLKRPYISSSMVLPIKSENDSVGVLNLGALKTSSVKFSPANMQTVNRLIDLTACAITP
jgi:ligand-binding sensor protein/putative methionine-R-sulfoxide reductase with GAF domain